MSCISSLEIFGSWIRDMISWRGLPEVCLLIKATRDSVSSMSQMRMRIWIPSTIQWPLYIPVITLLMHASNEVTLHFWPRVTCIWRTKVMTWQKSRCESWSSFLKNPFSGKVDIKDTMKLGISYLSCWSFPSAETRCPITPKWTAKLENCASKCFSTRVFSILVRDLSIDA